MNRVNQYYRHSGVIGPMGPVYMTLFGLFGAAILATIYGYVIFYIPFVLLNFIIAFGYGLLVGMLVGAGVKLGKVRNPKLVLLFGAVFGVVAEYAGWIAWIFASTKQEILLVQPVDLFAAQQLLAENGVWSVSGWTPTGGMLYTIWAVEGLMIIGTSTLTAWGTINDVPFCERCKLWIEQKHTVAPLDAIADPDMFKSRIEQADFSGLTSLKLPAEAVESFSKIELLECPGCGQNHLLSIQSINMTEDSDGKVKQDKHTLNGNLHHRHKYLRRTQDKLVSRIRITTRAYNLVQDLQIRRSLAPPQAA